jgi:hypothetical protein
MWFLMLMMQDVRQRLQLVLESVKVVFGLDYVSTTASSIKWVAHGARCYVLSVTCRHLSPWLFRFLNDMAVSDCYSDDQEHNQSPGLHSYLSSFFVV